MRRSSSLSTYPSASKCRGIVYYYRVDTEYAQEFINEYLP